MNERGKRKEGVARVKSTLLLSQFVLFLVPFGVGKSQQRDLVTESREREGDVGGLLDPVVKRGEEENLFTRAGVLDERLCLRDTLRQKLL